MRTARFPLFAPRTFPSCLVRGLSRMGPNSTLMKYDVLCLPGTSPPGCGSFYVESRLGDDHTKGDVVSIQCKKCHRFRDLEVRARLTGIPG